MNCTLRTPLLTPIDLVTEYAELTAVPVAGSRHGH